MRGGLLLSAMFLFLTITLLSTTEAEANSPPQRRRQRTIRYPRVYGPTGRPYGPTQAHYQYRRRYGRPWQGVGGLTATVHRNHIHTARSTFYIAPSLYPWNVYGSPYSNLGYRSPYLYANPIYNPVVNYQVLGYNSVLQNSLLENERRWKQPLNIKPLTNYKPKRRPKKTSTKAKIKSVRAIASGDRYFKQQDYLKALGRYRNAVRAAPDNAHARFRLGFVLAATGKYIEAVKEMKTGLKLDVSWPVTGQSLGRIFGRNNNLAKSSLLGKVTRWAGKDIRDPDRLFLIGVLLYFDSETDKAEIVFEAAYRLAGRGDHLIAFLRPIDPNDAAGKNVKKQKPVAPPKPKTIDELMQSLKPPLPKKSQLKQAPKDNKLNLPDDVKIKLPGR